jgi:hypothetical protein
MGHITQCDDNNMAMTTRARRTWVNLRAQCTVKRCRQRVQNDAAK